MNIIETTHLAKQYRDVRALEDVTLSLEPGHIYGLIGNNGAGKTTLFRVLTGLTKPTSGSYALFGETTPRGQDKARKRIGFLIENAVFYPSMTAHSNLRNIQLLLGGGKKERITEVLEQVGLNPRSRQPLNTYSMGMRQRYGIAAALVGNPDLLVLDEPLNGLDPVGAREINSLMRTLCEQGKTILLSSHLLTELYKTATDFIFMDHGHIIQQISHKELQKICNFCLTIKTAEPARTAEVLRSSLNDLGEIEIEPDCLKLPYCNQTTGRILHVLNENNIEVLIETQGIGLEDYFMQLVGGGIMVRAHLARLFRDRRLLACVLLTLLLAVYAGQPTVYERTIERLQEVPLEDVIEMYDLTHRINKDKITREDVNRFLTPFALSTVLCRTRSGPVLAAFVGSYLVGGWLKRNANCEIYTGRSRRRAALGICAITGIVAALLSLVTTLLVCVTYGRECLRFAAPAEIASRLIPALVWRMFFRCRSICASGIYCVYFARTAGTASRRNGSGAGYLRVVYVP